MNYMSLPVWVEWIEVPHRIFQAVLYLGLYPFG